MEILKQRYEEASKASLLRTPLHPVQQKSAIKSTPTNSSNITITNRTSQCGLQQQSAHRSAPNTLVPSKQSAVADRQRNTSSGCGKETSSERRGDCHNEGRKLTISHEGTTASTVKKHFHGQNSKQSIEHLPQPSHTSNDFIHMGNQITPLTAAAVTMITEVTEMDLTKDGSTEVTPERATPTNNDSTTKRRLKLEEEGGTSCRPRAKRRRTTTGDSSVRGKKSVAKLQHSNNSGQRTMQSYFQPA